MIGGRTVCGQIWLGSRQDANQTKLFGLAIMQIKSNQLKSKTNCPRENRQSYLLRTWIRGMKDLDCPSIVRHFCDDSKPKKKEKQIFNKQKQTHFFLYKGKVLFFLFF